MAFQYRLNDRRGEPAIQLIDGRYVVLNEFSSSTSRVAAALDYVRQINRRIRQPQPARSER